MVDKNALALKAKIDWEGWPDGCEWHWDSEFENPRIGEIVNEAIDLNSRLSRLWDELEPILYEIAKEKANEDDS